jgi:hypothetical protein
MSDRAAGRRLLQKLLPQARIEATKLGKFGHISPLAEAMRKYTVESNLDAIAIYPAPRGGWYCDVVLKSVPEGLPSVIGTPKDAPLPTKAEAEQHAVDVLSVILRFQNLPDIERDPVFLLYKWTFPLLPSLLEALKSAFGDEAGYSSEDVAFIRIEQTLNTLCPHGHLEGLNNFEKWSWNDKGDLLTVLHMSALCGVNVYPRREEASPVVVH